MIGNVHSPSVPNFVLGIAQTNSLSKEQEEAVLKKAYLLIKEESYVQAFDLFKHLAEKYNNSDAQNTLGDLYLEGLGVAQDFIEAMVCYKTAVENENTVALVNLGYLFCNGLGVELNFGEAVICFNTAAEKGEAAAFTHLGLLYQLGQGVPKDYKKAMTCFKTAAQSGDFSSYGNMGIVHHLGLGVPIDFKEAMTCYEIAARHGETFVLNNIGILYHLGLGVPQDFKSAMIFYKAAVESGTALAYSNIGELYQLGLGVRQDYKEAMKWFKAGAAKGSDYAFFCMALTHRHGLGVDKNEQKAEKCARSGAALASPTHPKTIEEFQKKLLAEGLDYLEKKNYSAALVQLLILAQINCKEAQFQIGLMYMNGLGVKQSDTNTVRYLTDAYNNNHPKAAFMLGESYMARSFFRRDKILAMSWYKKGSEDGDGAASYKIAELLIDADNKDDAFEIQQYLILANGQGHPAAMQKLSNWENQSSRNWNFSILGDVKDKKLSNLSV
ncbi:MAG: Sel1-repeat containing protein [Solimicrobium sp.]|jgi:TPR repeat protein|nr:Sel1-repeat containing protein [Solimicrobium sp.]